MSRDTVIASPKPAAVDSTAKPNSMRKFAPHAAKRAVNFGNLTLDQDMPDASPTPSAATSTITDSDWGEETHASDVEAAKAIIENPEHSGLVSQLTALMAAASITPAFPARHTVRAPALHTDREPRTSSSSRADAQTSGRACYNEFVHGSCSHTADECQYSHDPKVILDARIACMNNWQLGPKAMSSNFNVVSAAFPLETSIFTKFIQYFSQNLSSY